MKKHKFYIDDTTITGDLDKNTFFVDNPNVLFEVTKQDIIDEIDGAIPEKELEKILEIPDVQQRIVDYIKDAIIDSANEIKKHYNHDKFFYGGV